MIYIKQILVSDPKVTISSDKSNHQMTISDEDDIGALAEAFGFAWSPEELREPLDAAMDVLTEALKEGTRVDDPGYFTAIESGIKPYDA